MELFIVSVAAVGATAFLMTAIAAMLNSVVHQSTKWQEKLFCTEADQLMSTFD